MEFRGYQKGVNLGGWLSQCNHNQHHHETFITEADIRRIATWGVDHVRLPVDYELVRNADGTWKEDGFTYIDACINWCQKYHLNMILDVHKTLGYSFDKSKTCKDFFHSQRLQELFFGLWEEFAKRYGSYKEMVTFELLNEVVEMDVKDIWNGIAKKAIETIRKYAPDIYIIVGGVCNNSACTVKYLDYPYDDHIVYTFHFYEPLIFTHQSAYWVERMPENFHIAYPERLMDMINASIRNLPPENLSFYKDVPFTNVDVVGPEFFEAAFLEPIRIAKERNVPLYCGEFGVIDRADIHSTLNWFRDIISVFQKYNISKAIWNYKEKDFGISDPHYATIVEDIIKIL